MAIISYNGEGVSSTGIFHTNIRISFWQCPPWITIRVYIGDQGGESLYSEPVFLTGEMTWPK